MTHTITIPREVIERAINALQDCYDVESYPSDGSTQQDAALNELRAALAQQAEQVPATYQFRMKTDWMNNWAEWVACNKDQHEMYLREPKLHDWNYETRALYAAPQVAQQAEQGWVSLNDGLPQPHQMVLVARGKFVTTGSYSQAFGWEWAELDGEDDDSVATHWMAIPAAPKEIK